MKTTKRLLALNLVLVLLLTLMPMAALADAVSLELSKTVTFTKSENSENAEFTFTPDEDGVYQIEITRPYPKGDGSPEFLMLFGYGDNQKSLDVISDSDIYWENEDRKWKINFTCDLEAGKTYSFGFDNNANGDYVATVTYIGATENVVEIIEKNFPDANFRAIISDKYDINSDGFLSKVEIENATSVDVGFGEIKSLEGIGYFTAMTTLWCYGNQLTTLPQLPESMAYLSCWGNQLTSLPETLPSGLETLNCDDNQLTSLPTLPGSLVTLDCSENSIAELPELPESLKELSCRSNQLTTLPTLPVGLEILSCTENSITKLPDTLPSGLLSLACWGNRLTTLPMLPGSLVTLDCSENSIAELPELPEKLSGIYCAGNNIVSLPALPSGLEVLTCAGNNITSLPELPDSLIYLNCSSNKLTSLPKLPSELETLNFSENNLDKLPELPAGLYSLACYNMGLTELPTLPAGLRSLICSENELTELPETLPENLETLACDNNKLTELPTLPASLSSLYCAGNELTAIKLNDNDNYWYIDVSNNKLAGYDSVTGFDVEWDESSFIFGEQDHEHVYKLSDSQEPTHTENSWSYGWDYYKCENCAANYYVDIEPKHTYGDDGKCTVCGRFMCEDNGHMFEDHKCTVCGVFDCEAGEVSHSINEDTYKCTVCGGFACCVQQNGKPHELNDEGTCTICGNIIPDPFECDDGSKWTLTLDGTLTIEGATENSPWYSAYEYFGNFLLNVKKIDCAEGTTYFQSYYKLHNANAMEFGTDVKTTGELHSLLSLETITVAPENTAFCVEDGVLYNYEKTKLVLFPFTKSSYIDYTVKAGVTEIGNYAFYNCRYKMITLPDGVKKIDSFAFMSSFMSAVAIPAGLEEIGYDAFLYSNYLKIVYYGGTEEQWSNLVNDETETGLKGIEVVFADNPTMSEPIQGSTEDKSVTVTVTGYGENATNGATKVDVEATTLNDEQQNNLSNFLMTGSKVYQAYDITLWKECEDGGLELVQPDGYVQVKLTVPEGIDGSKCKVYHIENDGTVTLMDTTYDVENNVLVFKTSSFSPYVIVQDHEHEFENGKCKYCETKAYNITINGAPDEMIENAELGYGTVSATLKAMPGANAYDHVLFKINVTSPDGASPEVWATDSTGTEYNLAEIGMWGPPTGFKISSGYDATTDLKLKFDKAGDYTVTFQLVDLNNNSEVIAEGSSSITVKHNVVTDTAVEATCTEAGKTAGSHCSVCGEVIEAQEEIPANGHTEVTDPAVEPTCTETGKTAGSHCSVCGEVIKAQEEIPANGHTEVTDTAKEPTCTETGLTAGKHCSVCNEVLVKQEVVPAKDHEFKDGKCSVCGEKDPTYKPPTPPTPSHTHKYTTEVTAPTCTEKGYTVFTCACGKSSYIGNYVDALGHDFVNGVCSRCKAVDPDYVAPVVNPFNDVKEGDEFYKEIIWAANAKIVNGYTDGSFKAGNTITRAEVVTMLWRQAGSPEAENAASFADVAADAWYAKAVAWAVEKGITEGTSATTFEPEKACTRGEIVTFLWRANDKPTATAAASFTDLTEAWYKDAVAWAVEVGVTNGTSATTFEPATDCTRGQVAAFMFRLAQLSK